MYVPAMGCIFIINFMKWCVHLVLVCVCSSTLIPMIIMISFDSVKDIILLIEL